MSPGMCPVSIDRVSFLRWTHQPFDFYFRENKKQPDANMDGVLPESSASPIVLQCVKFIALVDIV